jgi:hypothetical protein
MRLAALHHSICVVHHKCILDVSHPERVTFLCSLEFAQERSSYSQVRSYNFSVNKPVADIQKASTLK